MKALVRSDEDVAWQLMLNSLNHLSGGFVSSTHAPSIRPWQATTTLRGVSIADYETQIRGWFDLLMTLGARRADRLAELLKACRSLPQDLDARVRDAIHVLSSTREEWDPDAKIWAALREEIHLIDVAGDRAPQPERLEGLQTLYDAMTPADLVKQVAWLFQPFPKIPEVSLHDSEAWQKKASEPRREALARIRASARPLESLSRLATLVPDPPLLGETLGMSDWAPDLASEVEANPSRWETRLTAAFLLAYGGRQKAEWLSRQLRELTRRGEIDLVVTVLRFMRFDDSTWNIVDELGEVIYRRYWETVSWVHANSAQERERAVEALLKNGRPGAALQTAGMEPNQLSPDTALRVLEAVRDASDHQRVQSDILGSMFSYYLARVFRRADSSADEARLAQLELFFFRALEDSERPPHLMFTALATTPDLFAQMVSFIYREEGAADADDATEEIARRARACDRILSAWGGYPGDAAVDETERDRLLSDWATAAIELTTSQRRSAVGLVRVSEVLARAAAASDGAWPAKPVRELLEGGQFPDLSRHLVIAQRNRRGMSSRRALDGGDQERQLASTYRKWANTVRSAWPRTSAMLADLASQYEREAHAHDEAVVQARLRYGD